MHQLSIPSRSDVKPGPKRIRNQRPLRKALSAAVWSQASGVLWWLIARRVRDRSPRGR